MNANDGDNDLARGDEGVEREPSWLATQEILDEARGETKRFMWFAMVPILLIVVTAAALFFASREDDGDVISADPEGPALQSESINGSDDDGDDTGGGSDSSQDDAGTESGGADSTGTDEDGGSDGDGDGEPQTVTVLPAPPIDGPYVDATLSDNQFVLSGVVPDEATKQLLEGKAELAYAPFFSSQLEVDPSVDGADWLAAAPEVVGLLPMITDGTLRIQDDAITLAGRSPNPQYAALFEGAVGQLTGLPVSSDAIAITNLVPPRFVATVEDSQVLLEGEIPSEAIGQTFIQGAAAVYGPENVTSTMTIDEGTYTSFWMYTMPGIFQLFQPFSAYEIQVVDGVTSGAMQGGVLFDINSADISEQAAQVLGVGVALLTRDRSLEMTVIGHTDSQGPRELNQELSLRRAESVVQFLSSNGIDAERLTADGKGPDEPLASNDTEEGRALNRRVEFLFD